MSHWGEGQWVKSWGAGEQRGRTPIVVGGTGFYLRWYVHGKPSTPRSTSASAAAAELALERVRPRPQQRALQLLLCLMACAGLSYDSSFKQTIQPQHCVLVEAEAPMGQRPQREVPRPCAGLYGHARQLCIAGRPWRARPRPRARS